MRSLAVVTAAIALAGATCGALAPAHVDASIARDARGPGSRIPRSRPTPSPVAASVSVADVSTTWIQHRLARLGYLPASAVTGHFGPRTRSAVLAFQGWENLARDAVPGPETVGGLRVATRPAPATGTGRRIEVHLVAQVAFLVVGTRVTRVIKVSTGAPGFATPSGSYRISRKRPRDWSRQYRVWLPYASYFNRGIAFHESPDVPAYPASHGCVRVPSHDAALVYAFAALGTVVEVLP